MIRTRRHIRIIKGGPGSGNFGHAGRPGKIGGSAPSRHEAYEGFRRRIMSGKWRDKHELGSQGAQAKTYYTYVKGGIHCVHKVYHKSGMAHNDEVTYLLSEELDIENVPITVTTDGENSFQRFANNAETVLDYEGGAPQTPIEDIENMMYLDVLTGNWDRHWGNFMINTKTGELIFIDNSSTLSDDRSDDWNNHDLAYGWGKELVQSRVNRIMSESISYTDTLGLPYGGFYPSDPGPTVAKYIKRSNFDSFLKKARSMRVLEIISDAYGYDEGRWIHERMMARLRIMEEYVDAIETVHGLRQ
jgi:hypothetical protein